MKLKLSKRAQSRQGHAQEELNTRGKRPCFAYGSLAYIKCRELEVMTQSVAEKWNPSMHDEIMKA
jgi:hypothetical protein